MDQDQRLPENILNTALNDKVISQSQFDDLLGYFDKAHNAHQSHQPEDPESPVFVKGLHDFLVSFGLILVGVGLAVLLEDAAALVILPLGFVLSEYLTRKKQYAFPSITICAGTAIIIAISATIDLGILINQYGPSISALIALCVAVYSGVYFWRYKLPFALGQTALVLYITAIMGISGMVSSDPFDQALPVTLFAGLAIFAYAVKLDLSDRFRTTGRSDQAFWLHLVSAPMLTGSLIALLTGSDSPFFFHDDLQAHDSVIVLALFLILSFGALLLDRRAIMFASTSYVIAVMIAVFLELGDIESGYRNTADYTSVALVIFGSGVIFLALGWQPLRRFLLSKLPTPLVNRLPDPYTRHS